MLSLPASLVYIQLLTIPVTVTTANTPQTKSSIPLLSSLVQPLASYINNLWKKRIEVRISRAKQQPITTKEGQMNRYKAGPIRVQQVHYHDSQRKLSSNEAHYNHKHKQGDADKDSYNHSEEMEKLLGTLIHTIHQIRKLEHSKVRDKSIKFEVKNSLLRSPNRLPPVPSNKVTLTHKPVQLSNFQTPVSKKISRPQRFFQTSYFSTSRTFSTPNSVLTSPSSVNPNKLRIPSSSLLTHRTTHLPTPPHLEGNFTPLIPSWSYLYHQRLTKKNQKVSSLPAANSVIRAKWERPERKMGIRRSDQLHRIKSGNTGVTNGDSRVRKN